MGKKSKRTRSTSTPQEVKQQPAVAAEACFAEEDEGDRLAPPSLRSKNKKELEETLENLNFEDPFEDEYEEEEVVATAVAEDAAEEEVRAWNPLTEEEGDGRLEMEESAYTMFHALTPEWPCLSFDILPNKDDGETVKFPHTVTLVAGTQADRPHNNKLMILRLSDLSRTTRTDDSDTDSDTDDDSQDEELDPILEHYSMRHKGGINRVRANRNNIVATWSELGIVNLYDINGVLNTLDGNSAGDQWKKDPFFVYQGHDVEGFAMDWSPHHSNDGSVLATGDCHGSIHLWYPTSASLTSSTCAFQVTKAFHPDGETRTSVEDIQWSPSEATVFATAECSGYIRIYDTRCHGRAMISNRIHSQDVNVIGWNSLVTNLLASGSDHGVLSVWDLRNFQSTTTKPSSPLARFTCHKKPITSVEWHPMDESMLVLSDEDTTYIYDLSIEEEDTTDIGEGIPPQLLFVHCGSQHTKEVHWHSQIPSLVLTTALSGFHAFIPSNL